MAGAGKVSSVLRIAAKLLIFWCLFAIFGGLINNTVFYQHASSTPKYEVQIRSPTVDYRELILNIQEQIDEIELQMTNKKDIELQDAILNELHDKSVNISKELKSINGNLSRHALSVGDLGAKLELLDKEIEEMTPRQINVNMTENDVKVILLTYMRSGSTFIGEILKQNPDVAYWFEPLAGVYSHMYFARQNIYPVDITHYANGSKRLIPNFEHKILADNLLALLNCDYENVAVETMFNFRGLGDSEGFKEKRYIMCLKSALKAEGFPDPFPTWAKKTCEKQIQSPCDIATFATCRNIIDVIHSGTNREQLEMAQQWDSQYDVYKFLNRSKCMDRLENVLRRCVGPVQKQCTVKTKAVKVIRLTMDTVERILYRNPNVKVIHLLRDPRGIVSSRRKVGVLSRVKRTGTASKMVTEAKILCRKMMDDIKTRVALEKYYARNFLEVRYESVVEAPTAKYEEIYQFLGIEPSSEVTSWITESTNASNRRQRMFGTVRSNSTETAYSWRKDITNDVMKHLIDACKDVISYLK